MWHTAMVDEFCKRKGITGTQAEEIKKKAEKFSRGSMFAGENLKLVLDEKLADEFLKDWNKDATPYLEAARKADAGRVGESASRGR